MEYIFKNSAYRQWFEDAEIVRENCHVLNMWSPAPSPFFENIIFVGDSAWTVEAECTGSMMSGLKAAHAISTAFRKNKLNQEGVSSYIRWWGNTFTKGTNYRDKMLRGQIFILTKVSFNNHEMSR